MKMNNLLALSHVPRWVIVPHVQQQSVATHCFRVQVITIEICKRLGIQLTIAHLFWALVHDSPESWMGDVPGPFKNSGMKVAEANVDPEWADFKAKLPSHVIELVKLADLIEAATFIRQYGLGAHGKHAALKLYDEVATQADTTAKVLDEPYERVAKIANEMMVDLVELKGRISEVEVAKD